MLAVIIITMFISSFYSGWVTCKKVKLEKIEYAIQQMYEVYGDKCDLLEESVDINCIANILFRLTRENNLNKMTKKHLIGYLWRTQNDLKEMLKNKTIKRSSIQDLYKMMRKILKGVDNES